MVKRAKPRHRATRARRPRVPALLAVLAVTALVTPGGSGVVGVASDSFPAHQTTPAGTAYSSSGGTSARGTDATGRTDTRLEAPRQQAISRDSERQALQDSAGTKLPAAGVDQEREQNAALGSLGRAAEEKAGQIPTNAWHLPTRGYHLTARFGQAGGHWVSTHTGLDFAAPSGTPIFAVAPGVITQTGWAGSYGNRTVETLSDGTELWYAHQSAIGVKVGQQVIAGQSIGAVGSTGNTTGPHVHLEVRPGGGDPVDPYQALVVHGVKP